MNTPDGGIAALRERIKKRLYMEVSMDAAEYVDLVFDDPEFRTLLASYEREQERNAGVLCPSEAPERVQGSEHVWVDSESDEVRAVCERCGHELPRSATVARQPCEVRKAAVPREALLAKALRQAADWFDEYAEIHDRKGDGDKSRRNQARADYCRAALTPAAEETP